MVAKAFKWGSGGSRLLQIQSGEAGLRIGMESVFRKWWEFGGREDGGLNEMQLASVGS